MHRLGKSLCLFGDLFLLVRRERGKDIVFSPHKEWYGSLSTDN